MGCKGSQVQILSSRPLTTKQARPAFILGEHMYKAIAIDMDGTLLKSDKTISPYDIDMVKRASKVAKVFICSARGPVSLNAYLDTLGLLGDKSQYTIAYNGAYIYRDDLEVIYDNAIKKETITEVISHLIQKETSLDIILYTAKVIKTVKEIEDLSSFIEREAIYKLSIAGTKEQISKWRHNLPDKAYTELEVHKSDDYALECVRKGRTKIEGLKDMCASMEIDLKDLMCIGDGENDVGMLEMAGLGVAMGNAKNEVKAHADVVTSTNDEDGVGKAIAKYLFEEDL